MEELSRELKRTMRIFCAGPSSRIERKVLKGRDDRTRSKKRFRDTITRNAVEY